MGERLIKVGEGDYTGEDNAVIQRAVDAVGVEGGGVVELPSGVFTLRDSIHLRSGVALVGQGTDTVLMSALNYFTGIAIMFILAPLGTYIVIYLMFRWLGARVAESEWAALRETVPRGRWR